MIEPLYRPGELVRELLSLWPVRSVEAHIDAWACVPKLRGRKPALVVLRAVGLSWEELGIVFDVKASSAARSWCRAVQEVVGRVSDERRT